MRVMRGRDLEREGESEKRGRDGGGGKELRKTEN